MKHLAIINPEQVTDEEARTYPVRNAARAVVIDADKNVALLHVGKESYYKLPGGGIEKDEDQIDALKRECQEEIGCDIEVFHEIGMIEEYRKSFHLFQISYCYFAKVVGEKGSPHFEEGEKSEGFQEIWLPFEEAMQKIKTCSPTNLEGDYIVSRDILFLEKARSYVSEY